jgi:4-hydroxy-2-oxoheptanedioate aldolase
VPLSSLQPKDYFSKANGFSLALAMIETREALAVVDEILAAPEIDGIFVGPPDLSIALSNGAENNPAGPEASAALEHALARAKAAGKFIGVYAPSGERGGELAKKGFDLVSIGTDTGFLRAGAQAALAAAR